MMLRSISESNKVKALTNICRSRTRGAKMKREVFCRRLLSLVILIGFFALPGITFTKGPVETSEIINPEGVIKIQEMKINPHPSTLEGKTVMLRWNGKHNGDKFLDRVAELFAVKAKDIKVIKSWEVAPETVDPISGSQERSLDLMKKLAAFKPDLVIGSQAD